MWQERLAQLVTTCHWIGAKGWAPATGGNMSVRQDDTSVLAKRVWPRQRQPDNRRFSAG